MKTLFFEGGVISALMSLASGSRKQQSNFTARRIFQTATFTANGEIETVFPLFGAFEERKLDYNWKPVLIYPDKEIIEEGTTFKTIQHANTRDVKNEKEYLWRVVKYEPSQYLIEYLVSTPNRDWTVKVQCFAFASHQTKVSVTYSYTGLNKIGNRLNEQALNAMFKHNLKDWEEGINYFLENGKPINTPK